MRRSVCRCRPGRERFDLLEEQLGIVRRLLTGEHVRETTAHYSVDATLGPYLGGRRPPPIVVGGEGKPRTVSLAARFSDELNLDQVTDPDAIRAAFLRLDTALDGIDRPRDAVVRSTVLPFPADLGEAADTIAAMQDAGVERFYMRRTSDMPLDRVPASPAALSPDGPAGRDQRYLARWPRERSRLTATRTRIPDAVGRDQYGWAIHRSPVGEPRMVPGRPKLTNFGRSGGLGLISRRKVLPTIAALDAQSVESITGVMTRGTSRSHSAAR